MRKGLIVGLALPVIFALAGCPNNADDTKERNNPSGGGKEFRISFELNWPEDEGIGEAPANPASVRTNKDTGRLTLEQIPTPTRAQTPEGYLFDGWYDTPAVSGGNRLTTSEYKKDTIFYARWRVDTGPEINLAGVVEELTLANAWFAAYRFVLPTSGDGSKWGDYEEITVDYLFKDQDQIDNGIGRAIRLMGNYEAIDFELIESNEEKYLAIASYNSGYNAPYIMHDQGSAYTEGSLGTMISDLIGRKPDAYEWFTISYSLTNTGYAQYDNFNRPQANDTGPFYFGVGLPGGRDSGTNPKYFANTFYIRNIKLVGKDGTPDLLAMPVIFETDVGGEKIQYPAFTGYPSVAGGDGLAEAARTEIGETKYGQTIARDLTATYEITFDYNYPVVGGQKVPGQPEDKKFTTSTSLVITSIEWRSVSPAPAPDGWRFVKWTKPSGKEVALSTPYGADTTLYAQWEEFVEATEPLIITLGGTPALDFSARGSNNKATYDTTTKVATYVSGTDANAVTVDQYILMSGKNLSESFGGGGDNNGTLAAVGFPANSGLSAGYTKVIIYYETVIPEKIKGTKDGADVEVTPTGDNGLAGNLKHGYNQWTAPVGSEMYPDFEEGTGTLTWNLSMFGTVTSGFSLQYYPGDDESKIDGWLLRITKLEFTTQTLIDAGGS
jgi:uncharacterized repeat protein (TIGR02543 family)